MGICESKPATTSAGAAPPAGGFQSVAGSNAQSVDKHVGKSVFVSPKSTKASRSEDAGVHHHLKNVFAAPIPTIDSSYKPPVFPKNSQEKVFLEEALQKNFVFANLKKDETKVMVDAFEKYPVTKATTIIKQGETGDYFYVLIEGTVKILVDEKQVGQLSQGSSFGELALLYDAPRAATVVAQTACTLWRVDQITFRTILQAQTVTTNTKKRQLLLNIEFLQDLEDADLNKLVDALHPKPFSKDQVLVKKGDVGDVLYVIQEGKVKVTDIELGHTTYQDQTLGAGDYFGERALVTAEPRAANCIAATDGIALTIDSETFLEVVGDYARLVLKGGDKRKLSALKAFKYTSPGDLSSLVSLIHDTNYEANHVIVEEKGKLETGLFLVRSGKIDVTSADGKHHQVIETGGYFGEEMLFLDHDKKTNLHKTLYVKAPYTVKTLEKSTIAFLSLQDCRKIVDTTILGEDKPDMLDFSKSVKKTDIQMEDLTKHKILGAGTFGQVWLVSRKGHTDASRRPYALKVQSKYELVENNMAQGVVQEKEIMAMLKHPFIISLVNTYQDKYRVYMLLEMVQGGELYSRLHSRRHDGVSEKDAQFYASVILEGLDFMHAKNVLFRDLKPENVLINDKGYPVIIDLGFAKVVKDKTYTFCGTPLYLAPEVILNRGHDHGADHWSLAVLIYEMMDGETPFYESGMDQISLFRAIVKGKVKFPPNTMSKDAQDLLTRMLVPNPAKRLGSLAGGRQDLFRHKWFKTTDFRALREMEPTAPWIPKIKDPLDASAFDDWSHLDDKSKAKDPPISKKHQKVFENF